MVKLEKHHVIPLSLLWEDNDLMALNPKTHKHVHHVLDLSYDEFNSLIEKYDISRNNSLIEKPNDVELRFLLWKEYFSNIGKLNNSNLVMNHVLHLKKLLVWNDWISNHQFLAENWFNWRIKNNSKSIFKLQSLWLKTLEKLESKDMETSESWLSIIRDTNSELFNIINQTESKSNLNQKSLIPTKLLWNLSVQNNWLFVPQSKEIKIWKYARATRKITNGSKIYTPELLKSVWEIQTEYINDMKISDRTTIYSIMTILSIIAWEEARKVWIILNSSQLASDALDLGVQKWIPYIINETMRYRSLLSIEIINTIWDTNRNVLKALGVNWLYQNENENIA